LENLIGGMGAQNWGNMVGSQQKSGWSSGSTLRGAEVIGRVKIKSLGEVNGG